MQSESNEREIASKVDFKGLKKWLINRCLPLFGEFPMKKALKKVLERAQAIMIQENKRSFESANLTTNSSQSNGFIFSERIKQKRRESNLMIKRTLKIFQKSVMF